MQYNKTIIEREQNESMTACMQYVVEMASM